MNVRVALLLIVAGFALKAKGAGDVDRGRQLSATCAACHGSDGNSAVALFPRLAGQHEDYLLHSLEAYKSGRRKNEIMNGQVANLSAQEMQDLAAYFAVQKGLETKR